MKMKRFLALALSLCMILSVALQGGIVRAVETDYEDLSFEKLDGVDVDLTRNDLSMELEQLDVDPAEAVKVIIVMESESVIEADPNAVVSEETQKKTEKLLEEQAQVIKEIENQVLDGYGMDVNYNYTWLLNGIAAEVPYGTLAKIASVPGVKQVLLQPVYEVCRTEAAAPLTNADGITIGRENTWAQGYTGEGMKIAIIDTGIDVDHQNFAALPDDKLTDTSANADTISAVLEQLNASDRMPSVAVEDLYYNSKVVYGFNYCDNNLNIGHDMDSMGDHGTHVAGIAAANKVVGSDVVGVAPDAQLYVMKVFGYNGGAYTQDILAALEDALILGADVVNMSLGTPAGFTSNTDEINAIYNRVAETNTVLSVSAGNNYTSGYANNWGTDANLTENPDNGVVGYPGSYVNTLTVGSLENWQVQRNYIDANGYHIIYNDSGYAYYHHDLVTLTGEYSLVDCGTGTVEEFEGLDLTGKIALIQRGDISFAEKVDNAAAAGAVGCLVYNNSDGEFGMDLTDSTSSIPCAAISMADGDYLLATLEENPELTVSFPTVTEAYPSDLANQMSDFSSWGPAPDLTLVPDITAPGGNIYSTINGGAYGTMSGTSMAAPNVAGMSALVMQYVKANFPAVTDYRTLVQNLLMSTSAPVVYDAENGIYYSPRQQGSGLANAYDAVTTQTYLTVDGCEMPKAELGDDPARTGVYTFCFNISNFGTDNTYFDLSTVAQTEGVTTLEDLNFMSGTPMGLDAAFTQTSDSLVLKHDVDSNDAADSHDAYLIYLAATEQTAKEAWETVSFRYDVDTDETVATADVQAYLDALVDNESVADLSATVLEVAAGSTAQVSVTVTLADSDKEYLDTYYTNGGYVEGFTFLTALSTGDVDLSLPYLAFYGAWTDAPVLDNGNYWDYYAADYDGEVVGNQYPHVLWTEFDGYESSFYPGMNAYMEETFDMGHISLSPNGDGYLDNIADLYISLLRNAQTLTFRYSDAATGEVLHEYTSEYVSKSVYYSAYGGIVPFVASWDPDTLFDWSNQANNSTVLVEVEATGAAEGDETETWSVPVRIDLEAPQLLSAQREVTEDGTILLHLTFKDNLSVAAVGLLSGDGNTVHALEGVEDTAPVDGYQTYTKTFDITEVTGKLMIILADYALNESYYGINAGGEGAPYGDLVAFQYNMNTGINGWVSFNSDVNENETTVFMSDVDFVAAEYVNGFVYAQTDTGALYGFSYADMLSDSFNLEATYITQLENVYQDFAYSYAEGKLYGLFSYKDDWGSSSEIYSINLKGEYYDEDMLTTVAPYEETWAMSRGMVLGLTLACDDEGSLYMLAVGTDYIYDEETGEETEVETNAQLWKCPLELNEWSGNMELSYFQMVGDTGLSMDYLQSMAWDHNTETLYWARFDAQNVFNMDFQLLTVDPETAACTQVGTLSGETCALFAPLSEEAAAKEEHANVPEFDTTVIGRPILRDDVLTMNVGGVKTLSYDIDPWYTTVKDVVWSSDNEGVVTVDQNGTIVAVGEGTAIITVAAAADESKFDTVTVEVTALDLRIEGIISAQGAGIGNVTGIGMYEFVMNDGIPTMNGLNQITASDDLNYGLSLSTSAYGRGSIWASEYGNTGMVYEIDPATGAVKDVLQPIDGDMLFGITYSEAMDSFTGLMNMYLYVDQPFNDWGSEQMLGSYDEEMQSYMWRRVNMLPYLLESNTGFVTNETGQGASSEIVFCGVTTIDGGLMDPLYGDTYFYDTYKDYMGNWAYSGMVNYQPTQTLVLLDNVGRLWYVDEVAGMTKTVDEYGNIFYTDDAGSDIQCYGEMRNGMFDVEIVDEEGNVSYSVFNIRKIVESPLTDMFREGTMPRITYHFSDIEFGGYTADGDPIFAMSLYDYWNNGTTNELYLYIPGHETDEMDYETWECICTPDRLYSLGNTGENNIIASIHAVEVTGGLDAEEAAPVQANAVNKLTAGVFGK